jgi:hypothetical protein
VGQKDKIQYQFLVKITTLLAFLFVESLVDRDSLSCLQLTDECDTQAPLFTTFVLLYKFSVLQNLPTERRYFLMI